MTHRNKILVIVVVICAAFLLGFVPEYVGVRNLRSQVASSNRTINADQATTRELDLDLLLGYVYLQINLKNYGLANQYATQFFNGVRQAESLTSDPERQKFLQSALSKRDTVVSGLAKGDPATVAIVQRMFQEAIESSPKAVVSRS